MEMQMN